MRVKKKDGENLTEQNLKKVEALLFPRDENTPPITKKEACQMLNISYNTARLTKILEQHKEDREYRKARRDKLRGTPVSDTEIAEIAMGYLRGDSIDSIAKSAFRPANLVKSVVDKVGIPARPANKSERGFTELLPTLCVAEDFNSGEIAWSAKHHCAVLVKNELSVDYQAEKAGFGDVNYEQKYGSKCYAIWVLETIDQEGDFWTQGVETGGYNAYALAYDLGKLEHLEAYGINLDKLN